MNTKINWNAPANSRELLMWGVLMLLVLVLGVKKGVIPLMGQVGELRGQLEAKQMELSVFNQFEKPGASKALAPGNSLRDRIKAKVQSSFGANVQPQDIVMSELMSTLTNPEYAQFARMEGFEFKGDKKDKKFNELSFEIKLVGSYEGLIRYLKVFHDLPYLVKIEEIQVAPKSAEEYDQVVMVAKSVLYISDTLIVPKAQNVAQPLELKGPRALSTAEGAPSKAPFLLGPRGAAEWTLDELKLKGTMVGAAHPSALINGEVFEIGNVVAGYKITSIGQEQVVMQQGEKVYVLKIPEASERGKAGANNEMDQAEAAPNEMAAPPAPPAPAAPVAAPPVQAQVNPPAAEGNEEALAAPPVVAQPNEAPAATVADQVPAQNPEGQAVPGENQGDGVALGGAPVDIEDMNPPSNPTN